MRKILKTRFFVVNLISFLLLINILFSTPLFATSDYWVDASRTSNGDGSQLNPWKNIGHIDWSIISSSLESDNATIYLSSRDAWLGNYSKLVIASSGNVNYLLTIDGNSKYNLVDTGNAAWQDENNSSNRAKLEESINIGNSTSYVTIKGFYLDAPTWGGVNLGSTNPTTNIHHITLENSIIDTPANNHGVWFGYAESGCSDIVVRNNTIKNTKLEGIYMGHYNYMVGDITGIIIENNTVIDCGLGSEGDIDIKPSCNGAIVRYNKHYRTEGTTSGAASGVVVAADNVQIYGNEIYNMSQKSNDWGFGIYLNADGDASTGLTITSALIYNNLIYDNDRSGIKLTANKAGYNMSGVKIYNNTIIGCGTQGIQATAWNATLTIEDMKNNIISSNAEYDIYVSGNVTITAADNNLYYKASGSSWFYGGEKTWNQWTTLGFDSNGKNEPPSLGINYKPDSIDDPSVDAGISVGSIFGEDKDRLARSGSWDIGAYEFHITLAAPTNVRIE